MDVIVRVAVVRDQCTPFVIARKLDCVSVNGFERSQVSLTIVDNDGFVLRVGCGGELWID